MNKLKGILVIALAIIICAFGYLYFSKKPIYAPTKEGEQVPLTIELVSEKPSRLILNGPGKYVNVSFGYSLELPSGYTVEYLDGWSDDKYYSNSDSSIQVFKIELKNESQTQTLNIDIFKVVKDISLEKWVEKHSVEGSTFSAEETYGRGDLFYIPAHFDVKDEVINGYRFLSFNEDESKMTYGFPFKYFFIEKGGSIFEINYPLYDDGTFRKVFETIRFVK